MTLCGPNFVVSYCFEQEKPQDSFFCLQRALIFDLRPKCRQITMLLIFEIFRRAANHGIIKGPKIQSELL